jgi:predicted nucleic acid-binding protein
MDFVLLDTDVLLDFFLDREPFSTFSANVLNRCEEGKLRGFTTPVIISNVYYLLSKISKHEVIIDKLKQLLQIIDVTAMNKNVVINALNSDFKDFEDALQNFSAIENSKITIILTRNTKDFKKSELAILTPEMYLKAIL